MGFGNSKGKRRKREGEVRHHQSFMLSVKGEVGELIGCPLRVSAYFYHNAIFLY